MPVNDDFDYWFEMEEWRYFRKQCARLLAGVVTKETSVLDVSFKEPLILSDARAQNVGLRPPRQSP